MSTTLATSEAGTPQTKDMRPHHGVEVSVAPDAPASRVSEVPADTTVEAGYADGQLRFRTSVTGAHTVYRIGT